MAQHCAKIVTRCNEAKENGGDLYLSCCDLASISPAIYEILSSTTISKVNLSSNLLTKLPAKFPLKFSLIAKIDLSGNKMSKLPDELAGCQSLQIINISCNNFISLPTIITEIKSLTEIDASKNMVTSVDQTVMDFIPSLINLNLEENPLDDVSHEKLISFSNVKMSCKGWQPPPPQIKSELPPASPVKKETLPPPSQNGGPPPPPPPPPPPAL